VPFFVVRQLTILSSRHDLRSYDLFSLACQLAKKINSQLALPEISSSDAILSELLSIEAFYLSVGIFIANRVGENLCPGYLKLLTLYLALVAIDSIIVDSLTDSSSRSSPSASYRVRNPYLYTMH